MVSVSMLTEGWDANNVTHIFGLRAFGSQLLCEQVVGRGLRRTNYTPDKDTGLLTEEYVDVYGIPFTVVPFKGRKSNEAAPDDKPKNHVKALPERAEMEIRFPVVEGYAFALSKNLIKCDVAAMETLTIEPNLEPTATFLQPTLGYQEGTPSQSGPFAFTKQNRDEYYQHTHPQAIKFQVSRLVVLRLMGEDGKAADAKSRVMKLQSRHQLFPQVLRFVTQYVNEKVNFSGTHQCELCLEKYVTRMVERFGDAIMPDDSQGEPPLLPVLNRYKPMATSAEVEFVTTRACRGTQKSHVNQVVLDTETWEASAGFYLESSDAVSHYVRNDHFGLLIPYEFETVDHSYEPDFVVVLKSGLNVILEVKGHETGMTAAKHEAARKWCRAVNQPGNLGKWAFHVCRNPHELSQQLEQLAGS